MIRLRPAGLAGVYTLLIALSAASLPARQAAPETKRPLPAGYEILRLQPSRSTPFPVKSAEVKWRGNSYYLLTISKIEFAFNRNTGHLEARAKAATMTFDQVNYPVSVAVFDGRGRLLGTARTHVQVERVWLGKVLLQAQTFTLDFGQSKDYRNAESFQITIGKQKVMTPDDWQANK